MAADWPAWFGELAAEDQDRLRRDARQLGIPLSAFLGRYADPADRKTRVDALAQEMTAVAQEIAAAAAGVAAFRELDRLHQAFPQTETVREAMTLAGIEPTGWPTRLEDYTSADIQRLRSAIDAALGS